MSGRRRNYEREAEIRRDWGKVSVAEMAERHNTSRGSILRSARRIGLKPKRRRQYLRLDTTAEAIAKRTTLFPNTIVNTADSPRLLVDGYQQQKLGPVVRKGKWKGLAIYALTLTERATCPKRCKEWATCYGNGMHLARRHVLGAALMRRLEEELDELLAKHRRGILVRLHVLGDFGRNAQQALPYVEFWREMLERHARLHVFGYTAHDPDKPVGAHLLALNYEFADRCRIRFSGLIDNDGFGSVVIDKPEDSRFVVCPVETGKAKDCGSCALCWTMKPTVEFVRH